jgi:alpha-D-xyloside xylohydrolase
LLGASAFKDDDGEGSFLGDVRFASGIDQRLMRNRYSVLYNQTMEEVIQQDLRGDGVLFMRSGSVGTQNLPFTWGGDNEANFSPENGLPTVVTAGLSAGLSGEPLWASDLGGYIKSGRAADDAKLFIRWTQYAAFSPLMEVHSQMNLGPWDYGAEALAIFRQYSILHMSLFPYRYAAAQESARDGMPIMRAFVLEHQDDERARAITDEYYYGPDLLVAPVITDATHRSVYLPKGEWLDYWTGTLLRGGRTILVNAPLVHIPLYVRPGTILPKIPDDIMTLVPRGQYADTKIKSLDSRRIYEIYPGKLRAITDFEGRTIRLTQSGNLRISGTPATVTLRWRFQKPRRVMVSGKNTEIRYSQGEASVSFVHRGITDIQVDW